MYSNDITLIGDAASTQTYALRSIEGGKSIRGDASAALGSPKTLTISHSTVTRTGQVPADRHLVRLDRTEVNSEGQSATASCYMVIESPRSIVTEAQQLDMVTQLKNFILGSGYMDKLLNNEP